MKPVTTSISTYKKKISRYRPFLLLGNAIDGRVLSKTNFEFNSLTDLKRNLPDALKSIRGEGEWVYELYQVPKNYKIWSRWGYYQYPNRGTKILTYNYHTPKIETVEFKDKELICMGVDNFSYPDVYPSTVSVDLKIVRLEFV